MMCVFVFGEVMLRVVILRILWLRLMRERLFLILFIGCRLFRCLILLFVGIVRLVSVVFVVWRLMVGYD